VRGERIGIMVYRMKIEEDDDIFSSGVHQEFERISVFGPCGCEDNDVGETEEGVREVVVENGGLGGELEDCKVVISGEEILWYSSEGGHENGVQARGGGSVRLADVVLHGIVQASEMRRAHVYCQLQGPDSDADVLELRLTPAEEPVVHRIFGALCERMVELGDRMGSAMESGEVVDDDEGDFAQFYGGTGIVWDQEGDQAASVIQRLDNLVIEGNPAPDDSEDEDRFQDAEEESSEA